MKYFLPQGKFGRKLFNAAFTAGMMLTVLVAAAFFYIHSVFREQSVKNNQYNELADILDNLFDSMVNQETGLRGYSLTFDSDFLEPYRLGTRQFEQDAAKVEGLKLSDPWSAALNLLLATGRYWHKEFAEPQVEAAEKRAVPEETALLEGKQAFDRFRGQYAEAESLLRTMRSHTLISGNRRIDMVLLGICLAIVLFLVGCFILIYRKIQMVAGTMSALTRSVQAYSRRQFDEPVPVAKTGDELADLIAGVHAMRLELREKFANVQTLADRDGLTGIPNRRYLNEMLPSDMEACRFGSRPFSLILCDIDHFKTFNDTYGHLEGDRILRYIAQLLTEAAGDSGTVCRYGGEEFCICIPGVPLPQAARAAENLLDIVHRHPPSPYQVTLSFGLAEMQGGESGEDLLRRADEALYLAKQTGRDCVRTA